MYKLGGQRKLGRKASHRKALVRNQVRSLLINGRVETTTPKAKVLKANAESFLAVQSAAKDDKAAKELLVSMSLEKDDIVKVLEYIKKDPKVSLVKVGHRDGDNAEVSKVRLIGFDKEDKKDSKKPKEKKETKKEKEDVKKDDSPPDVPSSDPKGPDTKEDKGGNLSKSIRSKLGRKERARSRSGI